MRYILPFSYFLQTRLLKSSVVFHVVFEWLAAAFLVILWGQFSAGISLVWAAVSYLAFISLYEIGYIVNDLFSAKQEEDGRLRGPQEASNLTIWLLIGVRLSFFCSLSFICSNFVGVGWWTFFLGLSITFFLHNFLNDNEYKVLTFCWLCWFRFMAPVIFVIKAEQVMGVAFAAALTYVNFRNLGYMSSKGLLALNKRQCPKYRRFFFLLALVGAVALLPFPQAHGGVSLLIYYSVVAFLGTLFSVRYT